MDAFLDGGLQGFFVGNSRSNASVSYTDFAINTGSGPSFDFNSNALSLGAAAADRIIAVIVHGNSTSSTARTVSSVTVGGTPLTQAVSQAMSAGGNPQTSAIWYGLIAAGTTGIVEVTFSGTVGHCAVQVYRIVGYQSATPITASNLNANTSGAVAAALSSLLHNAAVIAGAQTYNTGSTNDPTYSWSGGVTEDKEETFSGEAGTAGSASGNSTGSSMSPAVTPSASADIVIVAAAWN